MSSPTPPMTPQKRGADEVEYDGWRSKLQDEVPADCRPLEDINASGWCLPVLEDNNAAGWCLPEDEEEGDWCLPQEEEDKEEEEDEDDDSLNSHLRILAERMKIEHERKLLKMNNSEGPKIMQLPRSPSPSPPTSPSPPSSPSPPPPPVNHQLHKALRMLQHNYSTILTRWPKEGKEVDFFISYSLSKTLDPYGMVRLDFRCRSLSRCSCCIMSDNILEQDLQFIRFLEKLDQLNFFGQFNLLDRSTHYRCLQELQAQVRTEREKNPSYFHLLTNEHFSQCVETQLEYLVRMERKKEGENLLAYATSQQLEDDVYRMNESMFVFSIEEKYPYLIDFRRSFSWLLYQYVKSGGANDKESIKTWIVKTVAHELYDGYPTPISELELQKRKIERAFQIGALEKLPVEVKSDIKAEFPYVLGDDNNPV